VDGSNEVEVTECSRRALSNTQVIAHALQLYWVIL